MTDANIGLFDPRTVVKDSDYPPEHVCDHGDFGFAFNDSNFSDRVLRIYVLSEAIVSTQSPSECLTVVRVETLHISSPVLAARSPFFYKLFSNGMIESQQRDVIVRINASEEAAFMELLKFMYSDKLTVTTAPDVLDVLVVADKFDVASCIRCCSRLLRNLAMTPESVLVYLDLPSTVLMAEDFRPLTLAAKHFYVVHYKDITKFQDEILSLPLDSVEAIISSDDLLVHSEDNVYKFVLKWVHAQYPKVEDRLEIMRTRLAKFIRYPYMTRRKLYKEVLTCKELDPLFARNIVMEAICFQVESSQKQHTYISDEYSILNHRFVKRAYTYQHVKIVFFEQPHPHLLVHMDLKHDVCARLFPSGTVCSEEFNLGGQGFYLSVQCSKTDNMLQERSFRFVLGMQEKVAVSFAVDYEFAVKSKHGEEFVTKCKGSYTFSVKKFKFEISLFVTPWRLFIRKDHGYFIDDVLHLRTKLSVRNLTNKLAIE